MFYPYKEYMPRVGEKCFIAPTSQLIGRIMLQAECSIWYGLRHMAK